MEITSILAVLDGGHRTQAVLETALAAGHALDATVECLHVEAPVAEAVPILGEADTGATVHALLEADREQRARRRRQVEAAVHDAVERHHLATYTPNGDALPSGFRVGLRCLVGHAGPEVALRGRLFDLIVIGRPEAAAGGIDAPDFEATLLDTARPVLIVCDSITEIAAVKAMVAWDGSREAALALQMAMPLLTLATSVEVITVVRGNAPADPEAAAAFLRRHGIRAEGRQLALGEQPLGDVLIQACREAGAGLLVMGAYSHSPLGEYIFGGVTRRAFETSTAPILIAH